ncbi:hypothetical protein [Legionella waltersii]|uniref:Uncharacterized protein n=1 Tax=Legionella waltersii TaxID=66969 RepID=A0A0W1A2G5_9GAMM|nr:hypothetical protein [Legionella waltersii]KTD75566.1 hypothetical protein Lwal_2504 [Legionella waltersii]SNU98764.1 Uncharacterised protein [Legionella waltersii]
MPLIDNDSSAKDSTIENMDKDNNPSNSEASTQSSQSSYQWLSIGQGANNISWRSNFGPSKLVPTSDYEGPWVLKYPIVEKDKPILNAMNTPDRAIRVWNEVNRKLPFAGRYKLGWVSPYITNTRPSTDAEIANKLIELYNDTRRIVVDAATRGNFLTALDTGEVTLVDMDLALKRSKSVASMDFAKDLSSRFDDYWKDPELKESMPVTLIITQNLLYFEDQLSINCINDLCKARLISLDNICSLTWLRENHKKLTKELFLQIATLTNSGITVSGILLESLISEAKVKTQLTTTTQSSSLFFSQPIDRSIEELIDEYNDSSLKL